MVTYYSLPLYVRYFKQYLFGKKPFIVDAYGLKFYIRPRSYSFFIIGEIFGAQDYNFARKIGKPDVALDLGACIGESSIWFAKKLRAKKVIAVEMDNQNYEDLVKNVSLNSLDKKITALNLAISDKNGTISYTRNRFNHGMHRISRVSSKFKAKSCTLKEIFRITNLSKIDCLKMDIEGSEKYVLTEANKDIFKNKVSCVVMESHSQDDFDYYYPKKYLSQLGFKVNVKRQLFKRPLIIEAYKK